ncbi:hypothetical protein [Streptomyces mirabilis]|uniref:hypothetical protein n=1 Tax=Streptomyces mirabilis TaxID=68239 RepID=UPI003324E132
MGQVNLSPEPASDPIAYCLQAEAACKQANARDLHAHALCGIGMALTTSGDRDQAVTYFGVCQLNG